MKYRTVFGIAIIAFISVYSYMAVINMTPYRLIFIPFVFAAAILFTFPFRYTFIFALFAGFFWDMHFLTVGPYMALLTLVVVVMWTLQRRIFRVDSLWARLFILFVGSALTIALMILNAGLQYGFDRVVTSAIRIQLIVSYVFVLMMVSLLAYSVVYFAKQKLYER